MDTMILSRYVVAYLSHSLKCRRNSTLLRHGDSGFTDRGKLGIQSGFLRRYSPDSFPSPSPERVA